MKGLLKILGALVALVIVVPVIGIGIFLATFDADAFKEQVMRQVSARLGREVVVAGPVGVDLRDGLALSLKKVSIGNPEGFGGKDFADVGTIFVSVNWRALLERKVDVRRVALSDLNLNLVTNAQGKNNWDLPLAATAAGAKDKQTGTAKPKANLKDELEAAVREGRKPDFSIDSFAINSIELSNATITHAGRPGGKSQEIILSRAEIKIPAGASFRAAGRGQVNGTAFALDLAVQKNLREVREGAVLPLDLKLSYGPQDYDLKTDFSWRGKTYKLEALKAEAMGLRLSGELQADLSGSLPHIGGRLTAPEIDLTKLTPPPRTAAGGRLLATPIAASTPSLAFLRRFNANLALSTRKLVANPDTVIGNFSTRMKLRNGVLTLDPLNLTYHDVPWRGRLSVDAAQATPVSRIALHAKNVDIAKLAESFGSKSPVAAQGDITFDVTGRGLSPEGFLPGLGGTIELVLDKGDVDWQNSAGLAGALVKVLLPAATREKPRLVCAVARFNATDGILTTRDLLLESNYATVGGQGSVDLGGMTADLLLRPVPKGATTVTSLTTATPIRVKGPLAELSYEPQADAVLQKALKGVLRPGQKISTGVPRVHDNVGGNPCVAALGNPRPIMVDPPKTKQIIKDLRDKAKETYKDIRKTIKDIRSGDVLKKKDDASGAAAPPGGTRQAPDLKNTIDSLKGLLGK